MPCGSSKDTCNQEKNATNGHCAFEDLDHSVLQQPLNLGVTNIKQILKCVQSGSREVKDIILNECNIIYECKTCVGLFRSLANFMYHKRCYCKKHMCEDMLLFENFDEEEIITVQPETPKARPEDTSEEFSKMSDGSIMDLEKSDIVPDPISDTSKDQNSEIPDNSKEKGGVFSSNKGKIKVLSEAKNLESSMISRRTRDKNAQNPIPSSSTNRVSVKMTTPEEPPLKCAKLASEKIEVEESDKLDSCKEFIEDETEESDKNVTEESNKNETKESDKNETEKSDQMPYIEPVNKSSSDDKVGNMKAIPNKEPVNKSSSDDKVGNLKAIPNKEPVNKSSSDDKVGNQKAIPNKEIKTKKIEFSKISGMLEKNMPSFPKIIFKTIESNQNAVYQSNDKKKLETFGLSKKFETATVETKVDNDKLIIVLKKDVKSDSPVDSKTSEAIKQKSDSEKATDFHLTRRKRLIARTDCDVHNLKCLVCKTQFMSLKTLYFHMLSLHSKKRLYYPCPFCKTLFVQMYGVTRHLIAIHDKTKDQINKLREIIKKKSVWKKVDDVNSTYDKNISPLNYQIKEANPLSEIKPDPPKETETGDTESLRTVIKLGKNVTLHQCTKCNRVFGRKSSQVSHEKFCIMNNPIRIEGADTPPPSPVAQPSTSTAHSSRSAVSFLSIPRKTPVSSKPTGIIQFKPETNPVKSTPVEKQVSETKVSIRPKRGAEKQMHKDFVNSQTLKWRSANRVDTNVNTNKTPPAVKKNQKDGKNLEKKVLSIMNAEDLTCIKCDKKFSSYSNLRRHVAIHVGWTRFKCKFCDYQAYNKSQCWAHVHKTHSVDDSEMERSIVNLVNSSSIKKSQLKGAQASTSKHNVHSSSKTSPKTKIIPKVKISKKKVISDLKISEKKQLIAQKKETSEIKKVEKDPEVGMIESKKEKPQPPAPVQKVLKKDVPEAKKEKSQPTVSFQKLSKKDVENKKEKSHVIPIQKLTIPRETNYKSVTTSNPTTIILSKKIPCTTVQSIVTISPESASSTSKISSVRTSPRKTEIKGPGEKLITTLVTRSNAYAKTSPIQIKLPTKSNSADELSKDSSEKSCSKKERLISEWFPKKDLSSSSVRRESAPLIIGLVPAGLNARIKSPTTSPEKNASFQ